MKTTLNKAVLILFLLGISLSLPIYGQSKIKERLKQKKAEVEAQRVTFYNSFLNFTADEANKFWPLFNEYTQKQKDARKNALKSVKDIWNKTPEQMTKEEANLIIKAEITLKQTLFDLEKEYIIKFQSAIPVQKVAKLKQAENKFKKEILKKARGKKGPRQEEE